MIRALRRRHLGLAGGSSLAAAAVLAAALAARTPQATIPPPAALTDPEPATALAGSWVELAPGEIRARRIEDDTGSWLEIEPIATGSRPALQVFLSSSEIADPGRLPARARWLGSFDGSGRRFYLLPSQSPGAAVALYDPWEEALLAQAPVPGIGEG